MKRQLEQSQRFLDILHEVTELANSIEEPEAFIKACLQPVCKLLGRRLGMLWLVDQSSGELYYSGVIDFAHSDCSQFIESSQALRITAGVGLLGRALAGGHAVWIANLGEDSNYPRKQLAAKCSLRSAVAFAVQSEQRKVAVLEFYSDNIEPQDATTVMFLDRLGAYMGIGIDKKYAAMHLAQDMTTRRNLQEELQHVADEALTSSRLKSEFVANVSHEIRTPLAGILGMSELLATKEDADAETREIASYVLQSAQSLLNIVNDLLDFSKLEAGKLTLSKEWLEIPSIVEEVVTSVSLSAAKKGLKIITHCDKQIPAKLLGDRLRMVQVLLNFAHNAVKFTENGQIAITANVETTTAEQVLIRFCVTDTGIGIKPNIQNNLFEPFVQADGSTTRRYGGTGLGLSIARKLTQLMNGRIGVKSELGRGAEFWVSVPFEWQP